MLYLVCINSVTLSKARESNKIKDISSIYNFIPYST